VTGTDPITDLVEEHIIGQCKMYIAALRMADRYNCDAIGIQYQLGLADMAPASDLAEVCSTILTVRQYFTARLEWSFTMALLCLTLTRLMSAQVWMLL